MAETFSNLCITRLKKLAFTSQFDTKKFPEAADTASKEEGSTLKTAGIVEINGKSGTAYVGDAEKGERAIRFTKGSTQKVCEGGVMRDPRPRERLEWPDRRAVLVIKGSRKTSDGLRAARAWAIKG